MWNRVPNLIAFNDGSLLLVSIIACIEMHTSHSFSFNSTVKGREKF